MVPKFYSRQFKLDAIKLFLSHNGEKSSSKISSELGIPKSCLTEWLRIYKIEGEDYFLRDDPRVHSLFNKNGYEQDTKKDLKEEVDSLKKELSLTNKKLEEFKNDMFFIKGDLSSIRGHLQKEIHALLLILKNELCSATKRRDDLKKTSDIILKFIKP